MPPSDAANVDAADADVAKRCHRCGCRRCSPPLPLPLSPSTFLQLLAHLNGAIMRPALRLRPRPIAFAGCRPTAASQETDQSPAIRLSIGLRPNTRHFFASAWNKASLQSVLRLQLEASCTPLAAQPQSSSTKQPCVLRLTRLRSGADAARCEPPRPIAAAGCRPPLWRRRPIRPRRVDPP